MNKLVLFFSFVCLSQIAFAQPAFTSLGDSIPATILREVFKNTRITDKYRGYFLVNAESSEFPHLIINVWLSSGVTQLLKHPPSAITYYKGFPFVIYTGIEHLVRPDSTSFFESLKGVWSRLYTKERWNDILNHYYKTGHGDTPEDDGGNAMTFFYNGTSGRIQLVRRYFLSPLPRWPDKWLPKPGPPQDR